MTEGPQLRWKSEAPKRSLKLEYGRLILQGKQQRECTLKKKNKGEAESILLISSQKKLALLQSF